MDIKAKARELVSQMTIEEKASLLAGRDFWHTAAVERLGLPSIMMTDGPHGLRKQSDKPDQLGIGESVPATCFPPACATACSFDRELLRSLGEGIADECRGEGVSVILGPGVNIKRSPLCGRNFEYFSEDPLLAGELATAMIGGAQSRGVGVSLKHFALNSQEKLRMTSRSVADERTEREIYLSAFERAVKKAKPWTVMCSYNRMTDGVYASQSGRLLNDILRGEWGFDGLVVSDWGAVSDRVAGVRGGLDLEMPGVGQDNARRIAAAVQNGSLSMDDLDCSASRVTELVLRAMETEGAIPDMAAHHALAREAAGKSAVLLKNNGLLPGNMGQSAAVIGAFAKHPRYQGAGSSKINPTRVDDLCTELSALGLKYDYAPGYFLESDAPDATLIAEAVEAARGKDIVYLAAGLPDRYESEGFDRKSLLMPECHNALIKAVAAANPNTVVILMGGGVMETPWADSVPAILLAYLGGQAGAGALAELLLGLRNPSGKLAESWCAELSDNPSYDYFPGYPLSVEYRESIFVGYRYYDTANKPVRWPFGHGLSYTKFQYSDLRLGAAEIKAGEGLSVLVDITNTGDKSGAEIVQLYISHRSPTLYRAEQELCGFERVELAPGETKTVTIEVETEAFRYWDVRTHEWRVEAGEYELRAAASSRDVRLIESVTVLSNDAPAPDYSSSAPCYYDMAKGLCVSDAEFEAVLGYPIPPRFRVKGSPFTVDSTVMDIQEKWLGRVLVAIIKNKVPSVVGGENIDLMLEAMISEAPLRMLLMSGTGFSAGMLDGLVDMLNGKVFRGIAGLLGKGKS